MIRILVFSLSCIVVLNSYATLRSLAVTTVKNNNNNSVVVVTGKSAKRNEFVVDIITPSSNSHKNGASPSRTFTNFGSAVAQQNGTIFFVGGVPDATSDDSENLFMSYNVRTDTWTELTPSYPCKVDGEIVVIARNQLLGLGVSLEVDGPCYLTDKYAFDLSAQSNHTWVKIPTGLNEPSIMCAVVGAKTMDVYVLFGTGNFFRSSDAARSWTKLKSLPIPNEYGLEDAACAMLDDVAVVVAGGHNDATGVSNLASVYDVASDEWHNTKPMSKPRKSAQAVVVAASEKSGTQEQVVVVCGGNTGNGKWISECEQLNMSTKQWSPAEFNITEEFGFFGLFAV